MLTGVIAQRICDFAQGVADLESIQEIRIGLCYAAVRTLTGKMGIAALLPGDTAPDCRALAKSGFQGKRLSEFLGLLVTGRTALERTIGLACANALLNNSRHLPEQDAIELMRMSPADRVCMVGRFPPLVSRVEQSGAALSILEKEPSRGGILDPHEQQRYLRDCTVAIITATAILNGSIEQVLGNLGSPRHVAVLGPSTPLCPEAFRDTPVNHLGGSIVQDPDHVMRVVSEAGGTPALRPYLKFVNLTIDRPGDRPGDRMEAQ
jgi:uncharacterized protein (DUF4213/DUF364 family)